MSRTQPVTPRKTVVELRGGVANDLVAYARRKVHRVLTHTGRPVLHARVGVIRPGDPRPGTARGGPGQHRPQRPAGPRSGGGHHPAGDRRPPRRPASPRLEPVARSWEARRGNAFEGEPHEWRHDVSPTPRHSYYPRPPGERQVVRHKTICEVTMALAHLRERMTARVTFSLFVRNLPPECGFLGAAGLADVVVR